MELRRYYDPLDREWIAGWIDSEEVAAAFCGLSQVTDSVFEDWLAASDQMQYILDNDSSEPVAYGEIWLGEDEREVELAHLLVSNEGRGEGLGSELLRFLVSHVVKKMKRVRRIYVRNVQDNVAAAGALRKAMFAQLDPVPEDWSDEYDWYFRDLED